MIDHAVAEGMDRHVLTHAAGLDDVDLADADARVHVSAQVALWQMLAKAISDSGFGVRMGASFQVREAGLLGYVLVYSATLGAALERLARYSAVLNDAVIVTLERGSDGTVAVVQRYPEMGKGLPFAVDYRLAALLSVCREITGVEMVPTEVDFAYPQHVSTLEHARFFRCPLRFGMRISRMVFTERDVRLPVRRGDETLARYLSAHAEHTLQSLVVGSSIRERVRSTIWNTLSDGRPTLSRIAPALAMPPRTLQRRLAEEGTSLQHEVEDVRKAMAMALLRDRSIPIDEVAFLLGYPEPSTLFRSFKRWTGSTPQRYRSTLG